MISQLLHDAARSTKDLDDIPLKSLITWAPNASRIGNICDFRPISRYVSETIHERERVFEYGTPMGCYRQFFSNIADDLE